jgi:signal transduction histidine kinase/HPt (histidine-containing phosphotransfer) domain-containing protein
MSEASPQARADTKRRGGPRAGLFTPAVALLNRLTYGEKFLLISVLFAAPLALTMNWFIVELRERDELTRKEMLGTRYLRPAMTVVRHLAETRLRIRECRDGGLEAHAALRAALVRVDVDFAALAQADREYGSTLKSSESFSALRKHWEVVKATLVHPLPEHADGSAVKLLAELRSLVALVGDNLILDPEADTYQLMRLILLRLPEGQGLLAEAAFQGSAIALGQPRTALERDRLVSISEAILKNVEDTRRGMELAFRGDTSGSLASTLARSYGELVQTLSAYLVWFNQHVVYAPFITVSPAAIVEGTSSPLDATYRVWDETATEIDHMIEARLSDAERKQRIAWTSTLAILLVVAYLCAGLYVAIIGTVGRLEGTAVRMLRGEEPEADIALDTRDELGRVVESFNAIAKRLRREWEQAHEEKERALQAEAGLKRTQEELLQAMAVAESANQAKSRFLASMSHELRTPLNSVIGFSNVLLKGKDKHLRPDDATYLERILANGQHLLGLINSVLDLSKVEADQMALNVEPVALDTLVQDTVAQLEGRVVDHDVRLVVDVPAGLHPVDSDPDKLKQVLINLVGNAVKFTERGTVTVRVVPKRGTQRPERIEVIDTGIGVPRDMRDRIFEAFQQVDAGTARQFEGTGLGLTISRALCHLMGHRIELESEVGKGSTFRILLSAAPAARVGPSARHPNSITAVSAGGSSRPPPAQSQRPGEIVVRVRPALLELVPGFLQNRRDEIGTLRQSVVDGDFEAIRSIAHNIKGVGAAYGFPPITDIARAIEEAARREDAASTNVQINALADYLGRVVVAPT